MLTYAVPFIHGLLQWDLDFQTCMTLIHANVVVPCCLDTYCEYAAIDSYMHWWISLFWSLFDILMSVSHINGWQITSSLILWAVSSLFDTYTIKFVMSFWVNLIPLMFSLLVQVPKVSLKISLFLKRERKVLS